MVLYTRTRITINHDYEFDIDAQTGHASDITSRQPKPNKNTEDRNLAQLAVSLVNLAADMRKHEKNLRERIKIFLSADDKRTRDNFGIIQQCEQKAHTTLFIYSPLTNKYYNIVFDGETPAFVQIINPANPMMPQTIYDLHENYLFNTLCNELIYQACL